MMNSRLLTLCIIFMVCVNSSFAQERKKIDRTKQQTETKSTKSSSKSSSTSSGAKTTASSKPAQQSYFRISSQSVNFGAAGGTETFTVSSSGAWHINVNTASWGHLTRSGNTLTLKVDANTGTAARSDYFNIASGSKTIRVNISQSKGASLSVSSENLTFAASGGSQTLTVDASESWKIGTGTYTWGHLSANGNQLTVRIDANDGTAARTDYFTIKSGNLEKRINISQNAQPISSSSRTTTSSNTKTSLSSATTPRGSYIAASNYNYKYRRRKFNHAQDNFFGGFSVGYIQKQWTAEENGEKEKFGLFDDDKYMQGVQAGFRIDPQFGAGFGINSGLFYEYCWAKSDDTHDLYGTFHTTYEEHGLYLPAHLKFTMNFSKWFQLSLYGGSGFYYALSGHAYLRSDGETYGTENVFSDEDNWNKFNIMLEYGISVRINALQIDVTQSQGLNNWSDTDGIKIKQGRPLSVSATICF